MSASTSPPRTVLIVDDTKAHRALTARAVRSAAVDLTVSESASLAEARDALARGYANLAVIILDVNLPDGDGADLVGELRASQAYAATPIIMLSTSALEADRERALARGANTYLTKALDFKVFVEQVSCAVKMVL